MSSPCEHVKVPWGSTKRGEDLHSLRSSQRLKNDSALCSQHCSDIGRIMQRTPAVTLPVTIFSVNPHVKLYTEKWTRPSILLSVSYISFKCRYSSQLFPQFWFRPFNALMVACWINLLAEFSTQPFVPGNGPTLQVTKITSV